MKLARFDLCDIDIIEQEQKVIEEFNEWSGVDPEEILENLEESIDLVQSTLNYMNKIATLEQIVEAFAAHEAKLKGYEASGRVPKILGWVELQSDGYIEHLENIKKSLGEFVSANCSILRKYKKQGVKQIVFDIDEFRKMVDSLYCLHVGVDGIDDYIDLDDFGVELKGDKDA